MRRRKIRERTEVEVILNTSRAAVQTEQKQKCADAQIQERTGVEGISDTSRAAVQKDQEQNCADEEMPEEKI